MSQSILPVRNRIKPSIMYIDGVLLGRMQD